MPKPADYPDWANTPDDPGDLVKPPASRLARGWKPAEVPPAQYWNWWKNLVGRWFRWLEEEDASIRGNIDVIEKGNLVQAGVEYDENFGFRRTEPRGAFIPLPLTQALLSGGWAFSFQNDRPVLHTSSGGSLLIPLPFLAPGDWMRSLYVSYFATVDQGVGGSRPSFRLFQAQGFESNLDNWQEPIEIPKTVTDRFLPIGDSPNVPDGLWSFDCRWSGVSLEPPGPPNEKPRGWNWFLRIDAPGTAVGITLVSGTISFATRKPVFP